MSARSRDADYSTIVESLGVDLSKMSTNAGGTVVAKSADGDGAIRPVGQRRELQLLRELPRISAQSAKDGAAAETELLLKGTLGQGGMGIVHDALQVALDRRVAVKAIRLDKASRKNTVALLREAWVTGALEHPNVVPVHTLGRGDDGRPLLVMKRIEGASWATLFSEPDCPKPERSGDPLKSQLEILLAVCNAVAFAHSRGLIHRDLKPANVMLGTFGEVYVVDWGLAVSVDPNAPDRIPKVSEIETIEGTPHFLAPEMAYANVPRIGKASDVYLLGAILHLILTGKPRNPGDTLVDALTAAYTVQPYSYGPEVPNELASIANRATNFEPDLRFADAAAFRAELSRFLQHRHAHEVTDRALRRVAKLTELVAQNTDTELDRREMTRLLTEARFGFQSALRDWPDWDRAKDGLRSALRLMAGHELAIGRLETAEALYREMADLGAEDEELRAEIEAKIEAAERDRVEVKTLRTALHEHDLKAASERPSLLAPLLGVFTTGFFLLFALANTFGWFAITHELNIGRAVLFMVFVTFVARNRDRGTPDIAVVRRLRASFMTTGVIDLVVSGLCLVIGTSVLEALALLLACVGAFFLTLSAAVDRRVVAVGPVFFLFAFAAVLAPTGGYYVIAVGNIIGPAVANVLWRRAPTENRYG